MPTLERLDSTRYLRSLARMSTPVASGKVAQQIGLLVDLEGLNSIEIYRIRLAAPDAASLERHIQAMGLPQTIEICPDPALERGSDLFETVRGLVDAGIQTQLGEIERGFADLANAR